MPIGFILSLLPKVDTGVIIKIKMEKAQKIEISSKTIVFTIAFLLLLKILWIVRDLIFSLFIAFIIMSALRPLVSFLERRKIPRGLSALIVFILFVSVIISLLTLIFPPLIIESTSLIKNFPAIVKRLSPSLETYLNLDTLSQYLPNITSQFFTILESIFTNVVFILSTLFFSFYFLIEENFIKKFLMRFFDEKNADKVSSVFEQIEKRMSAWFWGELTLMTIIGVMTFIGLNLIGVRYAVPLALMAGMLEAIPNLGPTISAIPAFVVAAAQSYFLGFSSIALYFIIQQLENNLIVPWVMRKAVGLNPIITLIALIIGGRIGGVLGILLAIPITLFIETIVISVIKTKQG